MQAVSRFPLPPPARHASGLPSFRVERFRDAYIEQLYQIESCIFGLDSYHRDFFERLCDDNRDLLLVGRYASQIAGYAMGEWLPRGAEVVSLAVDYEYRGQGLGRKLLARLLHRFQEGGAEAAFLMVRDDNAVAANLYRSFGFRTVRRVPGYYTDGQTAIRMRLQLW